MTKAGKKIIAAAKEALSIAKGEKPAAAIWHKGHRYVPETTRQPIETAPKDRTPVLLFLRNDLRRMNPGRNDLERWEGLAFVGRHPGLADDGFDIGWQFAAPVGMGGFTDEWFAGWLPLPFTLPELDAEMGEG